MAAQDLTTRGSWKREFFRLTNTAADDDSLIEHDPDDTPLEGVLNALQVGLDDAQEFLLASGLAGWWVVRSNALTFNGSDAEDGGQWATLPDDFRRAAGDHSRSALVKPDGSPWGTFVEWEGRHLGGSGYYFRNAQLWLLRGARPPSPIYLEYVQRLELPDDDDTAFTSFPNPALNLIPAYAAEYAMHQEWLPGGPELESKIHRNLMRRRQEAHWKLRLHQGARRIRSEPVAGNHFWL